MGMDERTPDSAPPAAGGAAGVATAASGAGARASRGRQALLLVAVLTCFAGAALATWHLEAYRARSAELKALVDKTAAAPQGLEWPGG